MDFFKDKFALIITGAISIVKIGITKDDAEDAKQRFEEAGALVRVVGQRL